MRLSVIIITRNSGAYLRQTLESVKFADEIVIVDYKSSDATEAIASQYGARFVPSDEWPGFGPQKNKALSYATATWVLSIDSDEWLSRELSAEIFRIANTPEESIAQDGFWIRRSSTYVDKVIRFGDWQGDKVLRLFKRTAGKFSNDLVHEHLEVAGATSVLRGILNHYPVTTLADSKRKMWRYNITSGRRVATRKNIGAFSPWTHALWSFIRGYVLRLGVFDGKRGFQLAWFNAKGVFIRYEFALRLRTAPRKPWHRKLRAYANLYFIDHGFLRFIYSNKFTLPGPLYRSNQPSPAKLRQYSKSLGIKAIVNLRGSNPQLGWYQLESRYCDDLGIALINTQVYSRGLVSRERVIELKNIIDNLTLPALVHCKSGADRAGFFAVLYRHFRLGEPIERAKEELHVKYGHLRGAKTGILDFFFECYLKDRKPNQTFLNWVLTDFDKDRLEAEFKPHSFASFLVDKVFDRE